MSRFSEALKTMQHEGPPAGDDTSIDSAEGTTQRAGNKKPLKPIPPGGRGRRNPTYGKRHGLGRRRRSSDLAGKL